MKAQSTSLDVGTKDVVAGLKTTDTVYGTAGDTKSKFKQIDSILAGLIIVIGIGFISLLVTVLGLAFAYIHDSTDVYKESRDATIDQNKKLDTLIELYEKKLTADKSTS